MNSEKQSICFIGDSHLAALKKAWDLGHPLSGLAEPTFFGARFGRFRDASVDIEAGRLVPKDRGLREDFRITSGGMAEVELAAYDVFVVCGLGAYVAKISEVFTHYRSLDLRKTSTATYLVSDDFLELLLTHVFDDAVFVQVISLIRAVTKKRLVLLPVPLRSGDIYDTPKAGTLKQVVDEDRGEETYGLFLRALELVAARYDFETVLQPDETRDRGIFTLSEYRTGAVRFTERTPEQASADYAHTNAGYGCKVLDALLETLAGY